jgi:hypothetical protein
MHQDWRVFLGLGNKNIGELVEQLLDGQIVIPSIQRDYVWRPSQIPPLFESIYRGYPIGSILVWQTSQPIALKLAAVIQQKAHQHIPMVLLDGQQRLTSLAWVWKPETRKDGKRIDTRFDITNETFKNPNATESKNPLLIPVREMFGKDPDIAGILAKANVHADHSLFGLYFQRLAKLNTTLVNYQIPVMSFASDDYEEVSDVFARVNQGGRRLSKGDLINSAIAARWPEGLAEIEHFQNKLKAKNFELGLEAPLRLMSLMAGKGSKYIRLLDKDMQSETLSIAWKRTEKALELVVDFLSSVCLISSSNLLSSMNAVIIPAYLLHKLDAEKNSLTPVQRVSLAQWVYAVMAFSSYSGALDTDLEGDYKYVSEKPIDEALALLRKRAFGTFPLEGSISPTYLDGKNSASGLFKLLFINALKSGAVDWSSGGAIQLTPMTSGFKIEYHHFFPRARLKKYPKEISNSLANLTFITAATNKKISDRLPEEYVPALGISTEHLQQQLIPTEPELFTLERFQDFVVERSITQAQAINDMIGLPRYDPARATDADVESGFADESDDLEIGFSTDDDASA